jgi:hypothetical protein
VNRLALVLAGPLILLLLTWATAPVAGEIAGLLFGGLADGLRGALWAIGGGIGIGLALGIPLWVVTHAPPRRDAYTALPRPVAWWEGPQLGAGELEGDWYEVREGSQTNARRMD